MVCLEYNKDKRPQCETRFHNMEQITKLKEKMKRFDPETAKYKNDKMIAIYMKEELGGFAVHLVQK